jgi:hypothetical protein
MEANMHDNLAALNEARNELRKMQAEATNNAQGVPYLDSETTTEKTLNYLEKNWGFEEIGDGYGVRRGIFRYHKDREVARLNLAKHIVERAQPDPLEDPVYFSNIAFQAASIEKGFPFKNTEKFSSYILGTLHKPELNSFAEISHASHYVVVGVNSGLIEFVYQAAKSVIEILDEMNAIDDHSAAQADIDINQVKTVSQNNIMPAKRLALTLLNYFLKGYPRYYANETVTGNKAPALSILVSMAERWIIAHEYGHGMALNENFDKALHNPFWAEEFHADNSATILTTYSAMYFDGLPPEDALMGGDFALACLEIMRRAKSIIRKGEITPDEGGHKHPAHKDRADNNINTFRQFFDVQYLDDGSIDLNFVLRKSAPKEHGFNMNRSKRVHNCSAILFKLWSEVDGFIATYADAVREQSQNNE